MAVEDFSLAYEGPALDDGRMPVRELAPALLALGEFFQRANELTNPGGPPVNLEVRAFNDGSFEAGLSAVTEDLISALTSDPALALGTLMSLVTDGGRGVFAALRVIKGRIARQEPLPGGTTRIEDVNGNVFVAMNGTINILNDPPARKAASAAMKPLREEGVDWMRIERRGQDPVVLDSGAVEALDAWEVEATEEPEPLIDSQFDAAVTPITFSVDPRYIWRFQMGDQRISATFADEGFLEKIHRNDVGFLEGDTMVVIMRMRQWAPEDGRATEWTVVEVKQHRHPSHRQAKLPLFDSSAEDGDH